MSTAQTAGTIVRMAVRDLTDAQIRAYLDELRRPGHWTEAEFTAIKADLDAAWAAPNLTRPSETQVSAEDVQRLARNGEVEPGSALVDDGDGVRVIRLDQEVVGSDRRSPDGAYVLLTYTEIVDRTGGGDWAPNGSLDRKVAREFAEQVNDSHRP